MMWFLISIIIIAIMLFSYFVLDFGRVIKRPKFSGKEKAKHVIMISLDGLYEEDFDIINTMPAFRDLRLDGSYSKEVKSIYPTLTYVVHASMITGNYPNKHGIIHNHQLQPGVKEEEQRWYWYRSEIKGNTLYDKVADRDMTIASLFWPVTGNSKINYNLPEILALEGENQIIKLLKAGSPLFLLLQELKFGKYRKGSEQPYLDFYSTKILCDTIKNKRPNLSTIHLVSLDSMRHEYGVTSKEALDALQVYNDSITEIIRATKEVGIYDDTIFVITSDHGLIDIDYHVYLNNLFYREGLINVKDKKVIDFKAYCQSTGTGAYIYIKDNNNNIEMKARTIIENAMKDNKYGIAKIYSREELDDFYGDKSYAFAIEAKTGYAFKEEVTDYDIKAQSDYNKKYATHGYAPNKKGYKNVFFIAGKGIKENYDIGAMEMVDIAPTIAEILGIDYECDGKSLKDIYK